LILLTILAYLGAHFLAYAIWLRKVPLFSTERGIFLYHACSVVLLMCGLLVWYALFSDALVLANVVLACSVHGVYSMSFLELWALCDGGYSLLILDAMSRGPALPREKVLEELSELGTIKTQSRVTDLVRLGFIRTDRGVHSLTPKGRLAARLLSSIVRLANVSELN
jgi:hypothetical protein